MVRRSEFGAIDQPATRTGKPGRWRARYKDDAGQEHVQRFDTKKAAGEWLASQRVERLTGSWTDPKAGRLRLADWIATYKQSTVGLRPSTVARDDGYIHRYILPTLGGLQLGDIDHMTVRIWVAGLEARGLAPATVVKAAQILGKILAAAADAKLIPADPTANVTLPKVEIAEMRFLTPDEIADLARAMSTKRRSPHNHQRHPEPDYGPLVLTDCYSGLRVGELFALTGADVDLLHRTITVRHIVTEVSGVLHHGPPKTRAGRRVVPIPALVCDALAPLMGAPSDLIFTAAEGGPIRLASWRTRHWGPACRAADLAGVRPHDMRHTAVSLWMAAGADYKQVALWAGHRSVATVIDRYGHLYPGHERSVMDRIDGDYGQLRQVSNKISQFSKISGQG